MNDAKSVERLRISYAILLLGTTTSLIILPKNNFDPISVPKFSFIVCSTWLILLYTTLRNKLTIKNFDNTVLGRLLILFIFLLLINLSFNHYAFEERIYGISGRNTGVILYISYALLCLLCIQTFTNRSVIWFAYSLILANIGVCTYFVIQLSGNDFFRYTTFYGVPSSTLGNPNFVSGFIGFSAIAPWLVVIRTSSRRWKILSIFYTVVSIYVIIKSKSIQGLFAFTASCLVLLFFWVYLKNKTRAILLLLLASVCGVIAFLGLIGTGPLARFLTTSTLYSRLDYWRAALAMFWDSPLTGKGIDSYGDHYREFRDDSAFRRFGEGQVADSSHNVFLDLLSGGGLFIALVFFLINLVPISMLVRKILRTEPFDWTAVCLLSLWFGYLVQASVSINQIGVGIWGWLLTAIIYGHAKLSVRDTQFYKNLPSWRNKLLTTVVSLVFITLSVLPLKSDSTFYAASSEADGLKMKRIAESWPKDSRRIYLTSAAFLNAGYNQISLNLSILGTQHNPRAYFLWKQIYDNKTTSSNLRSIAEEKLFVIEPRFKNNG